MVFLNYSTMQMVAKIVFYGPGLCGKTTNLKAIYKKTSSKSRGEMVSLETETDRTLFFDLLPMDVGVIGGFKTKFQLYTVPGQVFYNSTRKLVLRGVDGIVFVADSQRPMLDANQDSFENLQENLEELGLSVKDIPMVLQYNKRDLPNILSVDELNSALNLYNSPYVEAAALQGIGVFETLKEISKLTLRKLRDKALGQEQPKKETVSVQVRDSAKKEQIKQDIESVATNPKGPEENTLIKDPPQEAGTDSIPKNVSFDTYSGQEDNLGDSGLPNVGDAGLEEIVTGPDGNLGEPEGSLDNLDLDFPDEDALPDDDSIELDDLDDLGDDSLKDIVLDDEPIAEFEDLEPEPEYDDSDTFEAPSLESKPEPEPLPEPDFEVDEEIELDETPEPEPAPEKASTPTPIVVNVPAPQPAAPQPATPQPAAPQPATPQPALKEEPPAKPAAVEESKPATKDPDPSSLKKIDTPPPAKVETRTQPAPKPKPKLKKKSSASPLDALETLTSNLSSSSKKSSRSSVDSLLGSIGGSTAAADKKKIKSERIKLNSPKDFSKAQLNCVFLDDDENVIYTQLVKVKTHRLGNGKHQIKVILDVEVDE